MGKQFKVQFEQFRHCCDRLVTRCIVLVKKHFFLLHLGSFFAISSFKRNNNAFCWEKLIRSLFLLSKMHLLQNKMKEQINQSIVRHWLRLFPSLRQFSNSISKKWCVFWGDSQIDPFFYFFIRAEILMSQAVCHRLKQMVVGWSNVWTVRRVG